MQPLVRLITSVCDLIFPVMTPVLDNVLHCPLILIAIEKIILKVSFQITHQKAEVTCRGNSSMVVQWFQINTISAA